ncbi:MAG: DUF1127 domain-containing protein [Gammaproteobacteria bacterium]|nr:DUF1127 domain-containing protein [Gammaproteobacteria bacterium]
MPSLIDSDFSFWQYHRRGPGKGWSALLKRLRMYSRRHLQRQLLLQLNDNMLKDMGISRADAIREGNKHFWQE